MKKINTKHRTEEEEIMDDFSLKGEELREALDKIAVINRLLGGNKLTLEGIQKLNVHPRIHIAGIAFNQFRGIGKIVNLVVTEMNTIPKIENSRDRVLFNQLVFDQLKQNILIPTDNSA